MEIRLTQTVVVSEDAISQEVGGETVILDLGSEQYFGLDKVGTRIWQLLQEKGDLQQIFDCMLDEFDVTAARLETDMQTLLGELASAGLISVRDSSAG